jgi:nitrile hydratase
MIVQHVHSGMSPEREAALVLRTRALAAALIAKGVFTQDELKAQIDAMAKQSILDGARLIARAWTEEAFKQRLLTDPVGAAAELGIDTSGVAKMMVVENTDQIHHLVVCTLCSCYPSFLLGNPPDWYKSVSYRARAVSDPRGVMREFGCVAPESRQVRVVDSTASFTKTGPFTGFTRPKSNVPSAAAEEAGSSCPPEASSTPKDNSAPESISATGGIALSQPKWR